METNDDEKFKPDDGPLTQTNTTHDNQHPATTDKVESGAPVEDVNDQQLVDVEMKEQKLDKNEDTFVEYNPTQSEVAKNDKIETNSDKDHNDQEAEFGQPKSKSSETESDVLDLKQLFLGTIRFTGELEGTPDLFDKQDKKRWMKEFCRKQAESQEYPLVANNYDLIALYFAYTRLEWPQTDCIKTI